jgi:hypothetical protein
LAGSRKNGTGRDFAREPVPDRNATSVGRSRRDSFQCIRSPLLLLWGCTAGLRPHPVRDLSRAVPELALSMLLWPMVRWPMIDPSTDATGGLLTRIGTELLMEWAEGATCLLVAWRDTSDGVRGELTVRFQGTRLSWGSWLLASTTARDALAKRLTVAAPAVAWREHLEEAARRFTELVRVNEPLSVLTGETTDGPDPLLPGWLYAGEPTLLYADGDTGKSLTALTLAVAMHSGCALPGNLLPTRAAPAAYLDWETSQATLNDRLGRVAMGLGIAPPPLLYKHMTRPLVDEANTLATEFARRHVGMVVIDSKMFAVDGGDGAAFHEPITAFYGALRLFAPAAVLVLNHVTNADARAGTPARPFGGAFAFNGPRLIWEAKRDQEIEDATAIVFTCRKANNLAQKPPPFGLRFEGSGSGAIHVRTLDLGEVNPAAMAGASLMHRVEVMLSGQDGPWSIESLSEALHAKAESIARTLRRLRKNFRVVQLDDSRWTATGQVSGQVSGQNPGHPAAPEPDWIANP